MQAFVVLMEKLAQISSAIILPYFRAGVEVIGKADGSPVTAADREAEAAMRVAIHAAFPEHGIIGEEYGNERLDAEYVWTLDPIDGTKSFVTGSFLFATLIGLLRDGQPVLGALHHPLTGHLLIGDGVQTRLNGAPVHVRPCARIEDATVLGSTFTSVAHYRNGAAYEALIRRAKLYRTWGDAHGYFLLASGYADVMADPLMWLWDVAPLIPIVEGAGGRITAWDSSPALPSVEAVLRDGTSAVATAGELHTAVITALT
jgi:histidinol phosphatase-like enzyme (inositol monophosphatase family)